MASANGRGPTPGEALGEVEAGIGTLLRQTVNNYYRGKDRQAAEAIREAESLEDATGMVAAMRRGRLRDVALVTSAVSGVGVGLLTQSALDLRIRGASPYMVAGGIAALAGVLSDTSLPIRTTLTVGGTCFMVGNYLWMKHRPHEGGAP